MKKIFLYIGAVLFFIPSVSHAEVIISEIAWMGTAHSSSDEWIELANTGNESVSLTGWKLHTADNSVNITLSGNIAANGFYLLERTDDTTVPNITADKIYSGALSDAGEKLYLENNGTQVQLLDASAKWPAGDKDTNQTMQWNGSAWITAAATPKAANSGAVSGSNENVSAATPAIGATVAKKIIVPHVEFSIPSTLYSGILYDIAAQPIFEYGTPGYGYYVWNMGDGSYFTSSDNREPFSYAYEYPGVYTISFAYYHASFEKKPALMDSKKVEVLEPGVVLTVIDNGKALAIKNTSDKQIDMSDWHLDTVSGNTIFPPMSFIAPKASITFTAKILRLDTLEGAKLYTPFAGFSTQVPGIQKAAIKNNRHTTNVSQLKRNHAVLGSKALAPLIVVEKTVEDTTAQVSVDTEKSPKTNHRTKTIVLGAVILTVIGLLLLLERFMAQKE